MFKVVAYHTDIKVCILKEVLFADYFDQVEKILKLWSQTL